MPFGDEILSIYAARIDGCSQLLFFQTMIVHNPNFLLYLDFGQFTSAFYMNVNGQMLIKIEEEPKSKYPQ